MLGRKVNTTSYIMFPQATPQAQYADLYVAVLTSMVADSVLSDRVLVSALGWLAFPLLRKLTTFDELAKYVSSFNVLKIDYNRELTDSQRGSARKMCQTLCCKEPNDYTLQVVLVHWQTMLFLVTLLEPYEQQEVYSMFYDKELLEPGRTKNENMETNELVNVNIKKEAFDSYVYIDRSRTPLRLVA